jgi:hypothetical protein
MEWDFIICWIEGMVRVFGRGLRIGGTAGTGWQDGTILRFAWGSMMAKMFRKRPGQDGRMARFLEKHLLVLSPPRLLCKK